jgi:hypothetical protein
MSGPPDDELESLIDQQIQALGDDELEALLGEVHGSDGPPQGVTDYANEVFSLPRIEEELAELVYDSTGAEALAAVRSDTVDRNLLTFVQGPITLDVDWASGATVDVVGQVDAPGPATVVVHRVDGSVTIQPDGDGEFTLTGVEPGLARITCTAGDHKLATDWFRL